MTSMTNDPTLAAARDNVAESLGALRKAVVALTAEQLNRRPAGEDSNPLGVLAMHALGSTRSWLALATGAPLPPRDRPTEFRTVVADADAFFAEVDATIAAILEVLDRAGSFDPARRVTPTWTDAHDDVTAAWALHHALAHLGEHVGHAQLTRDLFGD